MADSVLSLFSKLRPDDWRLKAGFSGDVETVQQRLFGNILSEREQQALLNEWLRANQPCLFGRAAARLDALSYCVLTESDLSQPDEAIRNKIQKARLAWTRDGYNGKKSGFILWVLSSTIASAQPSPEMLDLARKLCTLYLDLEIEPNQIYLDEIFLEEPGTKRTTWKWFAGVNYFCAQGDKRWWHDHRIPGGMAFSVNSVGHLVKSSIIAKYMAEMATALGTSEEEYPGAKLDSLDKALQVAMQTIDLASETVSGRATELLPDTSSGEECPIRLPMKLAGKDCHQYRGYYHTDVTLPSEYFETDIERPADIQAQLLDFTYLFRPGLENPDFTAMGKGREIRAVGAGDELVTEYDYSLHSKLVLSVEQAVLIESEPRLTAALSAVDRPD